MRSACSVKHLTYRPFTRQKDRHDKVTTEHLQQTKLLISRAVSYINCGTEYKGLIVTRLPYNHEELFCLLRDWYFFVIKITVKNLFIHHCSYTQVTSCVLFYLMTGLQDIIDYGDPLSYIPCISYIIVTSSLCVCVCVFVERGVANYITLLRNAKLRRMPTLGTCIRLVYVVTFPAFTSS